MTTRTDIEYEKFKLVWWEITMKTAEASWPASAVSVNKTIDDLEKLKFEDNWKIRILTTF